MFRLDGNVALITGGSQGIGRAIAELFAEVGARVAIVSRRLSAGQETVAHLTLMGGQAIHIQADVTNEADVKRSLDATLDRYGRLDILVNNAGVNHRLTLEATTEEVWRETFDANLRGAFLYAKHAMPHFQEQRRGCIINIAGLLGVKGGAGTSPAFAASKGALVTLTKSLAVRYGRDGIRVNCISPGFVPTESNRHLIDDAPDPAARRRDFEVGYPLGRLGRPEDIAYAALYLASGEAGWVTGVNLAVDGGLLAR
ncbi:MAG: SDR family oxidoreductase [Chloracidobacterium sp.]|uniref:SDR family oxidoreductase n=1 Tax=Chloracidobacterium validum TaxID=2821543 RepID=A0ABX8B7Z1_9BACT|nr:SDR family oxidoreductase [Chloracidobacterium validum]QUW03072.1 SDR family oxidoreductase [Chloracidobacterium validum]